jgi:hypothetical protein
MFQRQAAIWLLMINRYVLPGTAIKWIWTASSRVSGAGRQVALDDQLRQDFAYKVTHQLIHSDFFVC